MDFGGRTVAFKSLVGSHNYNLDINSIDTELISKIIINKVYQECKTAKIIWSE